MRPDANPSGLGFPDIIFAESWNLASTRLWALAKRPNAGNSTARAFKRLAQSLYFQAGAKQREQDDDEHHSALNHQQSVGFPAQFRKMPEDDHTEEGTSKNKSEAAEEQKQVIQECVRAPKRNRKIKQTTPKRDLHGRKNSKYHKIGD